MLLAVKRPVLSVFVLRLGATTTGIFLINEESVE